MWKAYHGRLSGELAVLGFLALVVWCCNQGKVFDKIAKGVKDFREVKMPQTGTDILHTVENVHMQLFIGMCFYFIFLAFVMGIGSHLVKFWVAANHDIKIAIREGRITDDGDQSHFGADYLKDKSRPFAACFRLREYYFAVLQHRRKSWPFLDEQLKSFEKQLCEREAAAGVQVESEADMVKLLRRWFPFDLYVGMAFRSVLEDMVEISAFTWSCVIIILLAQALAVRAVRDNKDLLIIWLIAVQIVIIGTALGVWIQSRRVSKILSANTVALADRWDRLHKLKPAVQAARLLQVAVFFTSYEFSRSIANGHAWQQYEDDKSKAKPLIYTLLLGLGFLPEGFAVGMILPLFAALVATGSLMQKRHVIYLKIIVQAHVDHKGTMKNLRSMDAEHFNEMAHEISQEIKHPKKEEQEEYV
jgi:hypothetical protein